MALRSASIGINYQSHLLAAIGTHYPEIEVVVLR